MSGQNVEITSPEEKWQQVRHMLQMKLSAAQATAQDAAEENEILLVREKQKEKEANQILKKLQQQHNREISEWRNKVETMEETLDKSKAELQTTITQLKKLQEDFSKEQEVETSCSGLLAELQLLKERNMSLEVAVFELERINLQLKQEKEYVEELHSNSVEGQNEMRSALDRKREELMSTTECLSELKEEYAVLKNEYDALKATPVQISKKGNSLFAEVADNRQVLKNNLDTVTAKYKRLKTQYQKKCHEISVLMAKKATLCRQLEEAEYKQCSFDSQLINTYKEYIKHLESRVQELQNERTSIPKLITNDNKGFKMVESMLEASSAEIESLKAQLEECYMNRTLQSEVLFRTKCELHNLQAHTRKREAELALLQLGPNKDVSSCTVPEATEVNENVDPKSVRFSSDVEMSTNKPIRALKKCS